MSYNGIGLSTPRGTGTSGYVQRNVADVSKGQSGGRKYEQREQERAQKQRQQRESERSHEKDEQLTEHERKRAIEVKVLEYEEKLEDEEVEEDEIEKRVAKYRKELESAAYDHVTDPFKS